MQRRLAIALLATLTLVASSQNFFEPEDSEFGRTTIDLGIVVADVEKSVKFYTEAIGFKELPGFSAPADFATDVGLTKGLPLTIRVLALGDGPGATKLKLMQVPEAKPKAGDNEYLHSQLGYRYITIVVTDTNKAMARLEKSGVKTMAKTPLALPKALSSDLFLTCVRDPDGNIVELVGPKK